MSVDKILSAVLGSPASSGFAGGLAGGLASGLLTSKKGRKLAKEVAKLGGIAAVGGLAYAAWSRYRDGQNGPRPTPLPAVLVERATQAGFLPPPERPVATEELAGTLLRAMIAAARADGKLDGDERRAIFDRVAQLDLSDAEKAELWSQLEHPVDLEALVAAAGSQERALEIYTASLLAIDPDTPAERGYLAMLAGRLGLPDELVAAVHREAASPTANVAA